MMMKAVLGKPIKNLTMESNHNFMDRAWRNQYKPTFSNAGSRKIKQKMEKGQKKPRNVFFDVLNPFLCIYRYFVYSINDIWGIHIMFMLNMDLIGHDTAFTAMFYHGEAFHAFFFLFFSHLILFFTRL